MYQNRSGKIKTFNSKIQCKIDNSFHSIRQLTIDCINFKHYTLKQKSSIHFNLRQVNFKKPILGQDNSIHLILRQHRGKNTQLGRATVWADSNSNGIKEIRGFSMVRTLRIS